MNSIRNPQVFGVKLRTSGLPRPFLACVKQIIDRFLGFHRFNAFYRGLPACEAHDFPRIALEAMNLHLESGGMPAETIPASGPLLVIANHAYGLIEVIALDALLLTIRRDIKCMANYHFAAIPEWRDRYIWVDRRGGRRRKALNIRSWRQCFRWLSQGGILIVFPAGRVAHFNLRRLSVTEHPWVCHIGALARRTNVPVLPVFFEGHNAWPYQLAGLLCPPLQDLLAINEATNKQNRKLRVHIGRLIQPDEISNCATDEEATKFMRQRVAALAPPRSKWN